MQINFDRLQLASAAAYELVKEYVGSKSIVMNVIDPVVQLIKSDYAKKHVGLIGTRQTVNSHIYKKKIDDVKRGVLLTSHATTYCFRDRRVWRRRQPGNRGTTECLPVKARPGKH